MEVLLILPVAALILPPRYSLRLAAAGLVVLLCLAVYSNAPPGHDSDPFGTALLTGFALIFFGAIGLGILARAVWRSRNGQPLTPDDFHAPRADRALIFLAMALPAGILALWLGKVVSGTTAPLRTHVLLLVGLGGAALGSLVFATGLIRAGMLGFSACLALIVADSMRLDRQIEAQLPKDMPYCLAIGPNLLPRDQSPPLMGLTAPKPILLVLDDDDRLRTMRWSFRWHGFVRGGTGSAAAPCARPLA